MRLLQRQQLVVAASLLALPAACGGKGGDEHTETIAFEAEAEPLPGFSFDTGLVPRVSPAQISLKLSAGGKVRAEALGTSHANGLTGNVGSGKLTLDLHVKMTGRLKIDSPIKSVDDELPGLKDIDIPIKADIAFDPFLLEVGQRIDAQAQLPETKLPPIPLGSVPGKLALTVAAGSNVKSSFHGTCLSVADGQASYDGEALTTGTLVVKGSLIVDLPAPLNKTIDLGEIKIPIPATTSALDFGTKAVPGTADSKVGTCPPKKPSGGTSADAGSTDADASKVTSTFTVSVDGVAGVTTGHAIQEAGDGQYKAVLDFTVPGVGPNTSVTITMSKTGMGCDATTLVKYLPDDGSSRVYQSTASSACGLTVTSATAKHLAGTFSERVEDQAFDGASHALDVTFDLYQPAP